MDDDRRAARRRRLETDARVPATVRVVGTGLLGTSVGLALQAKGVDVLLSDPSPTAQALARDLGAGRLAHDDEPAELVVVAAPPDVVADVVATELQRHPEAVITDVASVKAGLLQALRRNGCDLTRYVGGHPLAGRERSGGVAARADLFAGRPWVLTPTVESSERSVALVRAMVGQLGAGVSLMDAAEHDEAVAVMSHVPQVAASLVAARLRQVPENAVALAGQGIRDVTRIAASDPALWTQILAGNAPAVVRTLRAVHSDLGALLVALEALGADDAALGARGTIASLMASGNEGHARIPGKHGGAPTAYAQVVVLVPDRPGELARLLKDVGEAGVNLEDLRFEHSIDHPVGLAEVAVLPAAQQRLTLALQALGWNVQA